MNTAGDKNMNMKNLASAGVREGVKSASLVDGTKGFPEVLEVIAETKAGSNPTDGRELNIYLGFSSSATAGTDNPGALTGTDAAVADIDVLPQLVFAGAVVMAGSLTTTGVQRQRFWIKPGAEYVIPVAHNDMGVATSNVDSETKITIRPWYRRTPLA